MFVTQRGREDFVPFALVRQSIVENVGVVGDDQFAKLAGRRVASQSSVPTRG